MRCVQRRACPHPLHLNLSPRPTPLINYVRRLIEQTDLFRGNRIAFVQSNNIPNTNVECLTTIGNLYDILTVLFTRASFPLQERKRTLETIRPDNDSLDLYFDYAKEFFLGLGTHFGEIGEFFSAQHTTDIVREYRGRHGGSPLYRPIGLEIFTHIIARSTGDLSLDDAVALAAKLPRDLLSAPYKGVMWDETSKTIISGNRVTLREILCYMLGTNGPNYSKSELLRRYRRDTDNERIELPLPLA